MKKTLFLFALILLFSCNKTDNGKSCWDCYYLDNQTGKQIMPHEVFCDLTADQMDTVRYDQGRCNTVERKCFNMEFHYDKP